MPTYTSHRSNRCIFVKTIVKLPEISKVKLYRNSFLLQLSVCCALQELCALHAVNISGKDPPTSLQSPLSKIQTKPLHFHRRSCHPWCLNIHFLKHFSFPANVFTSRLWSTWHGICYDIFDLLSFLCVAHARYSSILAENTPEWLYFSSVGYHTNDHSFYSYFTSLSNLFLPAVFEYFTSYGLNPASEAQNICFGW